MFPIWHRIGIDWHIREKQNFMSSILEKTDSTIIGQALSKIGLNFKLNSDEIHDIPVTVNYINNADGTIRWCWAASQNKPLFLEFYATIHWKSKIIYWIYKLLFAFRLQKIMISGSLKIFISNEIKYASEKNNNANWAIFTGTNSINRKLMVVYQNEKNKNVFIKIPVTIDAKKSNIYDAYANEYLNKLDFKNIVLPESKLIDSVIFQKDIKTEKTKNVQHLNDIHENALQEWLLKDKKSIPLTSSRFWMKLEADLNRLNINEDSRIPKPLIDKINWLKNQIQHQEIFVNQTHGDFTPWNMFVENEKLCLFDLEYFNNDFPLFHDAFHFIYQNGILVKHQSNKRIQNEIKSFFKQEIWNQTEENNHIDIEFYETLYLLSTSVKNLLQYSKQEKWHTQVNWLMNIWNERISELLINYNFSDKKVMIADVMYELEQTKYAVLKLNYQSIYTIKEDSDIDIAIHHKSVKPILKKLQNRSYIKHICNNNQSFLQQVSIKSKLGNTLHLDFITAFKRTHLQYLSLDEVLNNTINNQNKIKIPTIEIDYLYVYLFYTLNNSTISKKYKDSFSKLFNYEKNNINLYINNYFKNDSLPFDFLNNLDSKNNVLKYMEQLEFNHPKKYVSNRLQYIIDSIKTFFFDKGFIITFSGVDGAGKTTIIENVKEILEKKYRKRVVVLRHRPSILPILSVWKHGKEKAHHVAANSLPRQGKNENNISSFFRFVYYYIDYFIGQYFIQLYYVHRGHIVLYDRYYFDFINDSKRSNINISSGLTYALYFLLLKPTRNFFLHASPEIIRLRKQELNEETILALNTDYKNLFNRLNAGSKGQYITIQNIEIKSTLNTIFNHLNYELA